MVGVCATFARNEKNGVNSAERRQNFASSDDVIAKENIEK